tara:strand:- start:54 stop:1337 length:1284 start_codon:yes stop_codon:yes gene_type:complete
MDLFQATLKSSLNGPNLNHWELNNGAVCVKAPIEEAPLTCIDFWCKAGSSYERPGEEGLAHFLEHMVFKGSSHLKEGEFDLQIEALGGSSNAATGFDDVHFYVLVPPTAIEPAFDLLLNLVLTPTIEESAFLIEREVVIEEIAQYKDQPDEQVFQKLLSSCFENHSYGRPILGDEFSLKSCTPKIMKSFHNDLYRSENCCISIAGSIPNNIEEIIRNSQLNDLRRKDFTKEYRLLKENPNFQKRRVELNIKRLETARLLMAWMIPPAEESLILIGADITTSLLTEGRCSWLVGKLREELQIVESIEMDVTILEQGSLIILEACCSENNVELVEKEINKMLCGYIDLIQDKIRINRAKRQVKNAICFGLEAPSQVASMAGSQTLWKRPKSLEEQLREIDYWDGEKIGKEIFPLIQPNKNCILIAKPNH